MDRSDFRWTEVTLFFLCRTELSFLSFLLVRSVFFPKKKIENRRKNNVRTREKGENKKTVKKKKKKGSIK